MIAHLRCLNLRHTQESTNPSPYFLTYLCQEGLLQPLQRPKCLVNSQTKRTVRGTTTTHARWSKDLPLKIMVVGLGGHVVEFRFVRRREDDGLKGKFVQHGAFDELIGSSDVPRMESQVLLEGVRGDVGLEGVVRVRRVDLHDLGRGKQDGGDEDGGREEGQTHGFEGGEVVGRGGLAWLLCVMCMW